MFNEFRGSVGRLDDIEKTWKLSQNSANPYKHGRKLPKKKLK